MTQYTIKVNNHLKATSFLWQTILVVCAVGYFLKFDSDTFLIVFAFYGIFAVPALFLHVEYWLKNRGQSVQLANDRLTVTKDNQSVSYQFADIEKVVLYKSASLDKGGIPLSPIESYHYARIVTACKQEVIITCLLTPKVDEVIQLLKGVKYERKKRLFCTTFWK